MSWYEYTDYESVAQRKVKAVRLAKKLAAKHGELKPAIAKGTKIATSFWGQSWNRNLERYQHYENRLPRGRSYVKNGFVIDLQVEEGQIRAMVSGSELYEVTIRIKPLHRERWTDLKRECSGQITSLIGLLQGQLPPSVMEAVTRQDSGLFPEPEDIQFICTCPDYADVCKHSAAAAYGVGARLDEEPHLLFLLRKVDHTELITHASEAMVAQTGDDSFGELDDLSGIFGIELETTPLEQKTEPPHAHTQSAELVEEPTGVKNLVVHALRLPKKATKNKKRKKQQKPRIYRAIINGVPSPKIIQQ